MSRFEDIPLQPKSPREYFEPLLVEDLLATKHPLEAHYGKCSIIGKLIYDENDKMYYLESLRIPALPQDIQLPDGYFRIRLITGLLGTNLPLNSTVEALGEVVLWNNQVPHHDSENVLTKTSQDLYLQLNEHYAEMAEQLNLPKKYLSGCLIDLPVEMRKCISDELKRMKSVYKIVFKPYHVSKTSHACDIIGANLEIKYLCKSKSSNG